MKYSYRFAIASGFLFVVSLSRLFPPSIGASRFVSRLHTRATDRSSSALFSRSQSFLFVPRRHHHCSHLARTMTATATGLPYALLARQNAETTNALIQHWKDSSNFQRLAKTEGDMTVARDVQDGEKLQVGIDFAKKKGVIDPDYVPQPYHEIDVLGKTPDDVAEEILASVGDDGGGGSVIVLCGLSGTGKGTTVARLRQKLESSNGQQVVTWSNGNIFRSATLLAATWCEQNCEGGEFDADKVLTKENLASFMKMLTFGKFNDHYDTRIHGLGLDMFISQVQNTELKSPKVSKHIPTVAQVTQGEVILFAADAVETMGKDGIVVLLEGRQQTVDYVRTPHRFTLVLSDESLIGKRRAAQRLMAEALKQLPPEEATDVQVEQTLDACLSKMVDETVPN